MSFAHLPAVLAEVRPLADRFSQAGFKLYLVGGIVRDQLLDRPLDAASDIDLTTDARPDDIKAVIAGWADAVWDQGERFGTVGCAASGREYEITTHRSEFYEPESRKPAVAFSDDVSVDLSRRDFTVNAMALALPDGDLIDPYGGATDLSEHLLRTPLGAAVSFGDDPLRMLRAARFVAGYDLRPDPDVVGSMAALAPRLDIVAVERRRDELDKLVLLPDPTPGLVLLVDTGVADYALPVPIDPEVVGERLAALPASLPLRLAALLVDEPATAGASLEDLRLSNEQRRSVEVIVTAARAALDIEAGSDAALRRFALRAGAYADESLALAALLDNDRAAPVMAHWTELSGAEDLGSVEAPLSGTEVMQLLGVEEGPVVGEAMSHLLDLRVEQGPMSAETAAAQLRAWWSAQPRNSSTS